MDIEELARILHDGNKKAVEQSKVLTRKKCTYTLPMINPVVEGEKYICDGGELYHRQGGDDGNCFMTKIGKKCPRCGGSGFEPFLTWEEITDDAREGRRIQAEHVNKTVVLPLENEIHELEDKIRSLRSEIDIYKGVDSASRMVGRCVCGRCKSHMKGGTCGHNATYIVLPDDHYCNEYNGDCDLVFEAKDEHRGMNDEKSRRNA